MFFYMVIQMKRCISKFPWTSNCHHPKKMSQIKESLVWVKVVTKSVAEKFQKAILTYSYSQSQADHTLHIKCKGKLLSLMYVDDIVQIGNDTQKIKNLKNHLAKKFEIKNLGKMKILFWNRNCLIQERNICFTQEI